MTYRQESCASGRFWQVGPGDTLYNIAIRTTTTVPILLTLNPHVNPYNLRIGSTICLPPEPVCPSGIFWRVAAGDTLFKIAKAANTTVERLMELNPNIDPRNLQIDQSICLPG